MSRRTDGAPYTYNMTLNHMGLFNPEGYKMTVSRRLPNYRPILEMCNENWLTNVNLFSESFRR